MVTHRKISTPAGSRGIGDAVIASVDAPEQVNLGVLRDWMNLGLVAARQGAALVEHMQRMNTQAATAWVQSLVQATEQAQQAQDLSALMALPAQLWNRQLDLWMRRMSEGSQHLVEAEMQWTEQARAQARLLGLPGWLRSSDETAEAAEGAADGKPAGSDGAAATMVRVGQMQDAWLGASQRWIDAMSSAVPH
jgi:hypothetical protein